MANNMLSARIRCIHDGMVQDRNTLTVTTPEQAFWRAKRAVGQLRDEVRSSWQAAYGEFGERATQCVA